MAEHGQAHSAEHYIKIWGILIVLLILSVLGPFVGEATGIQMITLVTAFGIAIIKAGLVMKHFMHLGEELKMVSYILASALIFMVLFFFGTAPDVMNHQGSRWENLAAKAAVERGMAEGDGHDAHGGGHEEHAGGHEAEAGH